MVAREPSPSLWLDFSRKEVVQLFWSAKRCVLSLSYLSRLEVVQFLSCSKSMV